MYLDSQTNIKYPCIEEMAALCYEKFQKSPKTGKPTTNEWTVFASVLQYNADKSELKLVAFGCGTKCLGGKQLCSKGLALNDSHAEVLARRAFLRYLFKQLESAKNATDADIFTWLAVEKLYKLKPDISFHFLSTQTPCGDACIIEASNTSEHGAMPPAKRIRLEEEHPITTIFTGAKLIGDGLSDAMQQTVGAVRLKPGRGERTLSVSCSDKLAKWNVLGVQGALLDVLIATPIYFATFNFCCASNMTALQRAIYKRWPHKSIDVSTRFQPQLPLIRIDETLRFEYAESTLRTEPSAAGIAWCEIDEKFRPYEIIVRGKRQGITKKQLHTTHAALQFSKHHLARQYLDLLQQQPALLAHFSDVSAMEHLNKLTYNELKQMSKCYQQSWQTLKANYFLQWTHKSKALQDFIVGEHV